MPVDEVSIGDYVLAGGEVAVLVIVEAVARLLPGVLGNAESHRDDSFAAGAMADLLEGPVYTKPAEWRGPRRPRGAASRPPRRDRPLAPRRGARAAPPPTAPTWSGAATRPCSTSTTGRCWRTRLGSGRRLDRAGLGRAVDAVRRLGRWPAPAWKNRPLLYAAVRPCHRGNAARSASGILDSHD